ncbi:transposase family protein [Rhodococcus wratislaviensis]|uniref:transposase family protein n=1 Tax=Rhodococcus wratislaviensis TaxID=44752 RepID=UPI00365AAD81
MLTCGGWGSPACDFEGVRASLPHLVGVVVAGVRRVGSTIRIAAEPKGDRGRCPRCDGESARVHSRYRRQLADTAIGGHPVIIDLRVRRFFCDTIDCTAKTFADHVPGLTKSRSRRTPVLGAMVTAIGLTVAGRAGARGWPLASGFLSAGTPCCGRSGP